MLKFLSISNIVVTLLFSLTTQAQAPEGTVEVMLASNLDDERGYCLDIAGGKGAQAPLDKGLQAHTCYHYTGTILEDQGFDKLLIANGKFLIPYFDVCMSVPAIEPGVGVSLSQCEDLDTQKFMLTESGQLIVQSNPELCVTVSSTEKREGRGGAPVHVMRPLSLEVCDNNKKNYQIWVLNQL